MAPGSAIVPRDFFLLKLRIFPGPPREYSLPAGGQEQDGGGSHSERKRAGRGAHVGSDRREFPAGGWQRPDSSGPAACHGHRPHPAKEILVWARATRPRGSITNHVGTLAST